MTTAPRLPIDKRFAPPTPFARLMWTHALSACGDACLAVSLAGSIFFEGPASGSREKILLYLMLTMAPFAIVAPVLGPVLDRSKGGRRLLIVLSCLGRALLCLFMARYILKPSPEGLLIYPLAFSVLVLAKGYSVAKSSLVPSLVDDEGELVRANSRLALISVIATAVGGAPAFGVQQLLGSDWSLVLATLVFGTAAVFAMKIPRVALAIRPVAETELEREELHLPSILLAGSAMAMMRAAVGFLAFFIAFALRSDLLGLGVAASCGMAGSFVGNISAPMLRERMREEVMLVSAMLTTTVLVLLAFVAGGVFGFAIAGFAVGVGAAAGKLGFDSLLQRDGPDAVRGRAFARFETRFQLAWVLGALLGIIPLDAGAGLLALGITIGFAGLSYFAALRAARGRVYRTTIRPKVVDELFGRAKTEVTAWGRRSASRRRRTAGTKRGSRDATPDDSPQQPSRRRR